ncbi:hypothetical protein ACFL7M_04540 [Thermodesulfobacteriota bacterium]
MHRFVLLIKFFIIYNSLFWTLCYTSMGQTLNANTGDTTAEGDLWSELSGGFNFSLRFLTYCTYQDIADSTQNPNNDFLKISRFLADLDIRPDARLNFRRLELSIKPRMNLQRKAWEDGSQKRKEDWDDEWFINEWLVRLRVTDTLFISYGRENLQWGPSYLLSPSNPFFLDNGRINPKTEVPGMDFIRLVWLPNIEWTISLIANRGKGRQEFRSETFEKTYALKIDYSGSMGYGGLILSHREEDRDRIGAFGGWTASDALLLYGEAGFSQGCNVLYPVLDNPLPFGASLSAKDRESSSWKGSALVGSSYTFLAGPTLTLEYFYNGQGYNDAQADLYYHLRKNAYDAYAGPLGGLSRMTLGRTVNSGLQFVRRNYMMLQCRQNDIQDVLNLSFSWIQNLDDDSGRFILNADYYLGDHIQVFSIGSVNSGSRHSEFRGILDSFVLFGLEYTF